MTTKFQVAVAASARREVQAIQDYIARFRPGAARKWRQGFYRHARSLASYPFRYEVIPEDDLLHVPCRHIIYGNYRIIYRIDDTKVTILHVVHAAKALDLTWFYET